MNRRSSRDLELGDAACCATSSSTCPNRKRVSGAFQCRFPVWQRHAYTQDTCSGTTSVFQLGTATCRHPSLSSRHSQNTHSRLCSPSRRTCPCERSTPCEPPARMHRGRGHTRRRCHLLP